MRSLFILVVLTIINQGQIFACSGTTGSVSKIICLADSLKATLTSAQISTLEKTYSYSNAQVWSNLPTTMQARIGLKLGDLTSAQLGIAKLIIKEISGTTAKEGYEEFEQLLLADDFLSSNGGGSSYGAGLYYLSFNGTPSLTGTFSVKLAGHHLHVENTYNNGLLVGGTPHFEAIEPLSFTSGSSTIKAIDEEKTTLSDMLNALSSTDQATAKLSTSYGDIVMGATNGGTSKDWTFPATKVGIKVGNLTSAQKTKVLEAIKTYVLDVDDIDANAIIAQYTAQLDETYIAYAGTTSLATKGDYVRIDGSGVWIEFSVQNGIVMSGVHYHSIWRDHIRDYGGQGGSGLKTTAVGSDGSATGAVSENNSGIKISIFPNPTTDLVTIKLNAQDLKNFSLNLLDANGKQVKSISDYSRQKSEFVSIIDMSAMSKGIYFINLVADNRKQSFRLVKE